MLVNPSKAKRGNSKRKKTHTHAPKKVQRTFNVLLIKLYSLRTWNNNVLRSEEGVFFLLVQVKYTIST